MSASTVTAMIVDNEITVSSTSGQLPNFEASLKMKDPALKVLTYNIMNGQKIAILPSLVSSADLDDQATQRTFAAAVFEFYLALGNRELTLIPYAMMEVSKAAHIFEIFKYHLGEIKPDYVIVMTTTPHFENRTQQHIFAKTESFASLFGKGARVTSAGFPELNRANSLFAMALVQIEDGMSVDEMQDLLRPVTAEIAEILRGYTPKTTGKSTMERKTATTNAVKAASKLTAEMVMGIIAFPDPDWMTTPAKRRSSDSVKKASKSKSKVKADDDDDDDDEEASTSRSTSRSTKEPKAAKSKPKSKIEETDEETDDDVPPSPKKSSKKSTQKPRKVESESESEEDLPPKKSAKPVPAPKPSRKAKVEVEDEDEDEIPPPKKSAKPAPVSKPSRKVKEEEPEMSEDEDEPVVQPVKSKKMSLLDQLKSPKKVPSDEEAEDSTDDE